MSWTDGQTDRQTPSDLNNALFTKVHCVVKTEWNYLRVASDAFLFAEKTNR